MFSFSTFRNAFILIGTLAVFTAPVSYSAAPTSLVVDEFTLRNAGVTDATIQEIRNFRINLLTFALNASYRNPAETAVAITQMRTYVKRVVPIVAAKLARDLPNGTLSSSVNPIALAKLTAGATAQLANESIAVAPAWSVETEVEWLLKQSSHLKSVSVPAAAFDIVDLLKQVDLGTLGGVSAPEIETENQLLKYIGPLLNDNAGPAETEVFARYVESRFDTYVQKIRNVGDFLSRSDQISFPNKKMEIFIKEFFNGYFQRLDDMSLRNIISDVLKMSRVPSEMELAQILFFNSGPAFGKALQQIGREPGMGETLKEIMTVLESNGKRVPQYMAEDIIRAQGGGYDIVRVQDIAWTGTIAQTQPAVMKVQGKEEDVAIRFIKPGVVERTKHDVEIFRALAPQIRQHPGLKDSGMPDIDKIAQSLQAAVLEDADTAGVRERQSLAHQFYNQTVVVPQQTTEAGSMRSNLIEFKVPKVFLPSRGESELLVTELVKGGMSFGKVYKEKKAVAEAMTSELVKLWYTEALFKKSSFFHGDLHQGNFLIVLGETEGKVTVFILDYGMAGQLNDLERKAFLTITMGTELNSPTTIARGLKTIIPSGSTTAPKTAVLAQKIRQKMLDIRARGLPDLKGGAWIAWYLEQGNDLPGKLATFSRGSGLMNQLPKVIGKEEILKTTMKEIVSRSMYGSFTKWIPTRDKKPRHRFPLLLPDLLRVSWDTLADRCNRLFSKRELGH